MVDGYIKALDTPYNLKKENGVDDMEKVFIKLTREVKSE
jgi:hypothetical protein